MNIGIRVVKLSSTTVKFPVNKACSLGVYRVVMCTLHGIKCESPSSSFKDSATFLVGIYIFYIGSIAVL